MLKYNKAMAQALSTLQPLNTLAAELTLVAGKGFFHKDGCKFLKHFEATSTNVGLGHFPDRTGYECFVNSLHVDDYVESEWLSSALQFASQLLEAWSVTSDAEILEVIVSSDEFGAVVKAHIVRDGECWLVDDLDQYDGPVLLATSEGSELGDLLDNM